jgi:hypothetical protein
MSGLAYYLEVDVPARALNGGNVDFGAWLYHHGGLPYTFDFQREGRAEKYMGSLKSVRMRLFIRLILT